MPDDWNLEAADFINKVSYNSRFPLYFLYSVLLERLPVVSAIMVMRKSRHTLGSKDSTGKRSMITKWKPPIYQMEQKKTLTKIM